MSEYVDTHILEANRIHAPQYDDDENTSLWTNDVSNGIQLEVGDKISVQGAFVSDLGAENSTIEFKGDVIQDIQTFKTTLVTSAEELTWETVENKSELTDPRFFLQTEIIERTETLENVRDTEGNFVVSYYKTNNGEYMFQMPIFFSPPYNLAQTDKQHTWSLLRDNTNYTTGVTLPPSPEHRFAGDYAEFDIASQTAMLLDNSRFAIFGRVYTPKKQLNGIDPGGAGAITSAIQSRDLFGKYYWKTTDTNGNNPLINKYIRIKDLIKLNVEPGFNTPTEISNVINEQLTQQSKVVNTTFNYVNPSTGNSINKRQIGPQNETPTNKLFDCHTSFDLQGAFAEFFYGSATGADLPKQNANVFNYMAGFEYIGIKRPEIYETGMDVKECVVNDAPQNFAGLKGQNVWWNQQFIDINGGIQNAVYDPDTDEEVAENLNPFFTNFLEENPFHDWNVPDTEFKYAIINTNYAWTRENLEKFQKFFQAQARYPELFDMDVNNNRLVYNKRITANTVYNGDDITVDTHRFLHLQSKTNEKMPKEMIVFPDDPGVGPAVPQFDLEHTSFGYDNIPGYFTTKGAAEGTVDTGGIDFSSVPLFVRYFKEFENDTEYGDLRTIFPGNSLYEYDEVTGKGLWGGFALRQPASLTVTSDAPVTLEKKYNIPQKYEGGGAQPRPPIPDNISFIAQVPKHADYMEKLGIYTQVGGGPPTIRNIWTMYDLDWYNDYVAAGGNTATARTRCIGFDQHPTAYGNNYIGLYNGVCGPQGVAFDGEWETAIPAGNFANWLNPTSSDLSRTEGVVEVSAWLTKIYCGAIAPQLSFDTTSSRFKFTDLHTPEVITPQYDATLTKGAVASGEVVPVPENVGKPAYKINKVFDLSNFSPSVTPYFKPFDAEIIGTTAKTPFPLPYSNPYCKTGAPFDMYGGVFFEQFGIDEKNWKKSFWQICGFKYEDLNLDLKTTGGIQGRVTNGDTTNLSKVTTNAAVLNDDLEEWSGGAVGVPTYNVALTHPKIINIAATAGGGHTNSSRPTPTTVICESSGIEATDLPTKTLRPYFTIRSDIIDDSNFNGGKAQFSSLPVVSILQKNQQYGDFFYGEDSLIFTVTKPRTITSVTTVITDPSGEKSKLSPNSAVLYKIQKNKVQQDIVGQVLKANKSK